MPENDLTAALTSVEGTWNDLSLSGPGRARLTSAALIVETESGVIEVAWSDIGGGSWRTGTLTVHGPGGTARLHSSEGLDQVWVTLVARVCPLPELARGHRVLGSRRGGRVDLQAALLTPLLQARRRLEDEKDIDARVMSMDARALRERLDAAVRAIAQDVHPASPPDRRGLEAELEEAMSRLHGDLEAMAASAERFREAPEQARFSTWRQWVSAVQRVYAEADACWASAARLLPRIYR